MSDVAFPIFPRGYYMIDWPSIENVNVNENLFRFIGQNPSQHSIFFKPDGTKVYALSTDSQVIYQYSLSTAWDLSTSSYDSKNIIVGSYDDTPRSVSFKSDGTKMYVSGDENGTVYQFSLTTAWDISTAAYDSKSFDVSTQDSNPLSIFFRSDGLKMYVLGDGSDTVYQYTLSVAWDVSTATYDSKSFDISSVHSIQPYSIFFKSDGLKMYTLGDNFDEVYQYTLSVAWDVSTATYDTVYYELSSTPINVRSVFFKSDGSSLYVADISSDNVSQHNLSSSWDISTASFSSKILPLSRESATMVSLFFKDDGTKMYTVEYSSRSVSQYSLSTAWNVSTATYDTSFSFKNESDQLVHMSIGSNGTKMYMIDRVSDAILQYTLSSAWDVSTASYDSKSYTISEDTSPNSMFFKSDGTKMYVIGDQNNTVYQYTLSTPWDVSTASYDSKSFDVTSEGVTPFHMYMNSSGTKMFILQTSNVIFQYTLSTPYDVSTASYDSISYDTSSQDSNSRGLFFKSDGSKMFVLGNTTDSVYQYTVSIAWNLESVAYGGRSFTIDPHDTFPAGLFIKSDGTKLYFAGDLSNTVYQYTLSTPYDVSTALYDDKSYDMTSEVTTPSSISFKTDGTKMYVLDLTSNAVYQYTLSVAWDVSTASYDSVRIFVWGQDTFPKGIFFKTDGAKMYMVGDNNNEVYQYTLSASWDLSTATYDSESFYVGNEDSNPFAIFIKSDGTKMFMMGDKFDSIYQYSLSGAWDVTTASYDSKSHDVSDQDTFLRGISFNTDGSKMILLGSENDSVYQYDLLTEWDVKSSKYDDAYVFTAEDSTAQSTFFGDSGTKLYVVGYDTNTIYQYSLSSAWDVSTAVYVSSFDIKKTTTNPLDIFFNSDGTKLYALDGSADYVREHTLSTAWDITTTSTTATSVYVGTQDLTPYSIFFRSDGLKMYLLGAFNRSVFQYSLSVAWDISTLSYDSKNVSISPQDLNPRSLFFKDDGTKMYMLGASNDKVYQYTLSSAWDVSTATYSTEYLPTAQDTAPRAIFFKDDGAKMFILGDTNDAIYQYALSASWDVSTSSYDNKLFYFKVGDEDPRSISFNEDGTKMFMAGATFGRIHQYTLYVPWVVPTVSSYDGYVDVNDQDITPVAIFFNTLGTKMYVIGGVSDLIYQYTLSTTWDVTTASYDNVYLDVSSECNSPISIYINIEGKKMHVLDGDTNIIYEYTLSVPWNISTASYDSKSFDISSFEPDSQAIFLKIDGFSLFFTGTHFSSRKVYQCSLSIPWDLNSRFYDIVNIYVRSLDNDPHSIFIDPSGSSVYVLGNDTDTVYQLYTES
jgi:sugar lactone lactonase YvrE